MRIVYYAEDGTEFETQSQCEAYESEQENARKNFQSHMYDKDGDEVFLDEVDPTICIDYFDIKTDEDYQLLWNELVEKYGFSMPDYEGQWYYNYEKDRWCSYEDYKGLYLLMNEIFEGK